MVDPGWLYIHSQPFSNCCWLWDQALFCHHIIIHDRRSLILSVMSTKDWCMWLYSMTDEISSGTCWLVLPFASFFFCSQLVCHTTSLSTRTILVIHHNNMSAAHASNAVTANRFYSESFFQGPFLPASSEYITACANAVQAGTEPKPPLIPCIPCLVVFFTKCSSSTHYALFELNQPVSVLMDLSGEGPTHALYSVVRAINIWSENDPHKVKYMLTVKVHVQPDFAFDWSNAIPWPGIMHNVSFIHPHAFLTPSYGPMLLTDTLTGKISLVCWAPEQYGNIRTLQMQIPHTKLSWDSQTMHGYKFHFSITCGLNHKYEPQTQRIHIDDCHTPH